ncbi:hypothetical protein MAPG_03183 [Magnaporthiopsis poae ATCC 64411]|uniref:Uncharacterized protein n=1 Tax=Magnaporthiopsis poae (strain ATCC 64411 / 73-15) TaxID=644358 RepID=A0A0C4DTC1_MAGP6|nr:hypothetical protein MAPG_03183 [Magnaporthiopsis poae ATCC 64411]
MDARHLRWCDTDSRRGLSMHQMRGFLLTAAMREASSLGSIYPSFSVPLAEKWANATQAIYIRQSSENGQCPPALVMARISLNYPDPVNKVAVGHERKRKVKRNKL